MLNKQFNKAIILITILLVGVFFGLVTASKADANQVLPQPKPIHIKIQAWAENEWEEIKTFQKQGWEDGKAQLARNKQQITNLFNKAKDLLTSSNEKPNQ